MESYKWNIEINIIVYINIINIINITNNNIIITTLI